MNSYEPPQTVYTSKIVYDARYFNSVPKANCWYIEMLGENELICLRLKQVLLPELIILLTSTKKN